MSLEEMHALVLEPQAEVSKSAVMQAYIADPAVVTKITGRDDVPPTVYKLHPQGARVNVLLDRPPETYGGLLQLPESCKELMVVSTGLVISVGPQAGRDTPYPGGPICHPSQLLYRHVSFPMHSGVPLRIAVTDEKYKAAILTLSSRDIQNIDWDDDPYEDERVEIARFRAAQAAREAEEAQAADRLKRERLARAKFVNNN